MGQGRKSGKQKAKDLKQKRVLRNQRKNEQKKEEKRHGRISGHSS